MSPNVDTRPLADFGDFAIVAKAMVAKTNTIAKVGSKLRWDDAFEFVAFFTFIDFLEEEVEQHVG
jgi:hypothetical protein